VLQARRLLLALSAEPAEAIDPLRLPAAGPPAQSVLVRTVG
jgi:hypothetical protein